MEITAEIKSISYKPLICKTLKEIPFSEIDSLFYKNASFILNFNDVNKFAVSWWVSAKRTRSYPYSRVYDTLSFAGKKATVIPIFKDEGIEGDRDYIQWDTISLMSLLGVYVIISYYKDAEKSKRYARKITNQRFDMVHIKRELTELLSFQSSSVHWNTAQLDKVRHIGRLAIDSYRAISDKLSIEMHSLQDLEKRITQISEGSETFKALSRGNAEIAQGHESHTTQPKELLTGEKAILTIQNHLGGKYYFTADEACIEGDIIVLAECKHSANSVLPSIGDIQDGLIKMVLFTNLDSVSINGKRYKPRAVLKLTTELDTPLSSKQRKTLELLEIESKANGFNLIYPK